MLKITKVLWLFGVLCVCAVWGGTVFADTCNPGEYMVCSLDPQYGSECNDCGCATCPPGQTSDGTGFVSYCPNQSGSTGCYTPTDHCPGYTTCPSGVGGSGKKCKEVSGCSVTGCQRYAICNTSNGAITYQITGPCHLEGSSCYSNTVPCSTFDIDHWAVGWNCDKSAQVNNATWNANKNAWDTKNCTCSVVDRNLVSYGGVSAEHNCIKANADFYVPDANRYLTTSVTGSVYYAFLRQFCRQCAPGYLPTIINSPSSGVSYRPESTSGNWGTYECKTPVRAPNYADGCEVDFSKPTGNDAVTSSSCTKSCSAGYATQGDGATSENDCEFDTSALFHDATGDFTLGNMTNCPTNGG